MADHAHKQLALFSTAKKIDVSLRYRRAPVASSLPNLGLDKARPHRPAGDSTEMASGRVTTPSTTHHSKPTPHTHWLEQGETARVRVEPHRRRGQ
jgi:hypothetical protein